MHEETNGIMWVHSCVAATLKPGCTCQVMFTLFRLGRNHLRIYPKMSYSLISRLRENVCTTWFQTVVNLV